MIVSEWVEINVWLTRQQQQSETTSIHLDPLTAIHLPTPALYIRHYLIAAHKNKCEGYDTHKLTKRWKNSGTYVGQHAHLYHTRPGPRHDVDLTWFAHWFLRIVWNQVYLCVSKSEAIFPSSITYFHVQCSISVKTTCFISISCLILPTL